MACTEAHSLYMHEHVGTYPTLHFRRHAALGALHWERSALPAALSSYAISEANYDLAIAAIQTCDTDGSDDEDEDMEEEEEKAEQRAELTTELASVLNSAAICLQARVLMRALIIGLS